MVSRIDERPTKEDKATVESVGVMGARSREDSKRKEESTAAGEEYSNTDRSFSADGGRGQEAYTSEAVRGRSRVTIEKNSAVIAGREQFKSRARKKSVGKTLFSGKRGTPEGMAATARYIEIMQS